MARGLLFIFLLLVVATMLLMLGWKRQTSERARKGLAKPEGVTGLVAALSNWLTITGLVLYVLVVIFMWLLLG